MKPRVNPWWIAASVMLATFMEVLDTSVANVALPHIAGSLSASTSEATWVLTSYLVSNAIVLPASAWLGQRFGRTRFLTACILLFTFASALCGLATNMGMLVIARVLQGIGGGALQPMAMAILIESFPPAQRGMAMSVYGMGIVVAPILGPTLGGWLTDNYSWRWIFYINIPFGALAYFMINAFVEDPPYIRDAKPGRLDWIGLGLLTVWLGTLQVVLDKGQEVDWFSTPWLKWFALASVVSMVALVAWELLIDKPLVNFRVLRDRNLAISTLMITVMGMVLYGSNALLPLFLQGPLGYPALQSGLAVSPRGVGSIVGMLLVGRMLGFFDGRKLTALGFAGVGLSTLLMSHLTLEIAKSTFLVPIILNGFCVAFVFVPLSALGTATLSNEDMGHGTGLFNLMRNIGGSVGISLTATLLERFSQIHQNDLVGHLTPYDPAYNGMLTQLQHALGSASQALGVMYATLQAQASLLAFVSTLQLMSLLSVLFIPLLFLMRKTSLKGAKAPIH
jgi:DHA2 family multidrug resistance protein